MFNEHQDRVFAFCYSLTGVRAEAEDAAQETFLRAWRSLRQWDADRREALNEGAGLWSPSRAFRTRTPRR